jgi:hypothetical protein
MPSKRSGPGALAGATEASVECSEQPLDTTKTAGPPAATPAISTAVLKRINEGGRLPRNHAVLARALLADTTSRLSQWDRDFLASLERFNERSPRQCWALRKICRRAYEVRIGRR